MNKEEIKKAIKVVFNEECKECYFPKRKCSSCVRDNKKKIKKHIKHLESILDKVTDKLKEDANQKIPLAEDMDWVRCRKEHARKILKIIEGEKK